MLGPSLGLYLPRLSAAAKGTSSSFGPCKQRAGRRGTVQVLGHVWPLVSRPQPSWSVSARLFSNSPLVLVSSVSSLWNLLVILGL